MSALRLTPCQSEKFIDAEIADMTRKSVSRAIVGILGAITLFTSIVIIPSDREFGVVMFIGSIYLFNLIYLLL